MPDKDASTPRVYLIRHGETEWSQSAQYTGITDLPLTENGVKQVASTGIFVVGNGKLIDPAKLARVYISPRKRAQTTFDILFGGDQDVQSLRDNGVAATTEALAEWTYGEYEGLRPSEIRAVRRKKGLDKDVPWDIWRDGCPGGETPTEIAKRLDGLVNEIRGIQAPNMNGERPADVLLVAHAQIMRAFAKRFLGFALEFNLSMMIEPGGVGCLSYQHHSIDEPALLLGLGLR